MLIIHLFYAKTRRRFRNDQPPVAAADAPGRAGAAGRISASDADTANGRKQQALRGFRDMPLKIASNIGADMRRNGHHASVLVALGAVDATPFRFSSITLFGRVGITAVCDSPCHREHTAIPVHVFASQFGHLTKAQTAPRRE